MRLVCIFQVCIHLQRYGVIIVSVYFGGKAGFEDTMSNNNLYVDGDVFMEYSPKCPYCEINDYIVLEKKFRKAGTVVGGVAGAAGATSGGTGGAAAGAAIGSFLCPGIGTAVGGVVGGVLGALSGGAAGATVGYTAGKQIDKFVGKYRCERCKNTFEADVDD